MSAKIIRLDDVQLIYPIYSVRAQSLRHAMLNLAVGGRLLRSNDDVVHVNALEGISFTLDDGDRLGIIGHNGSGKSTLLKVLAGVYEPTRGRVEVNGELTSMLDIGGGLDWDGTGVDNIKILSRFRGLRSAQIDAQMDAIIEFSELGAYADLPMKTYSAGMTARLLFTLATSFSSDILLMDEWLGVGDAQFIQKAADRMNEMVNKSRVMVLASHSIGLVEATCNKILVLDKGRMRYFGPLDEMPDHLRPEGPLRH
jgi:ABC-type polysaccharide/polyol phosphate transport system ATPase subunit